MHKKVQHFNYKGFFMPEAIEKGTTQAIISRETLVSH